MDATTELVDRLIDDAARFLRESHGAGKNLTPWETTQKSTKKKWIALAKGVLAPSIARLEEAERELEWYGEQARLCRLIHSGGDAGRHALSNDGGKRARDFLKGGTDAK